jgi:hypothetical protein
MDTYPCPHVTLDDNCLIWGHAGKKKCTVRYRTTKLSDTCFITDDAQIAIYYFQVRDLETHLHVSHGLSHRYYHNMDMFKQYSGTNLR